MKITLKWIYDTSAPCSICVHFGSGNKCKKKGKKECITKEGKHKGWCQYLYVEDFGDGFCRGALGHAFATNKPYVYADDLFT